MHDASKDFSKEPLFPLTHVQLIPLSCHNFVSSHCKCFLPEEMLRSLGCGSHRYISPVARYLAY